MKSMLCSGRGLFGGVPRVQQNRIDRPIVILPKNYLAASFRAELATHHTFLTTIHLEQILLYRYLSFSEFCSLLIA